jgi:hypothetical protein
MVRGERGINLHRLPARINWNHTRLAETIASTRDSWLSRKDTAIRGSQNPTSRIAFPIYKIARFLTR